MIDPAETELLNLQQLRDRLMTRFAKAGINARELSVEDVWRVHDELLNPNRARRRAKTPSVAVRDNLFADSTFAKQIAEIEAGFHPPVIYHGDLTSQRDLSDVRDIVRAYWLALEKAEPGESYNVGSGKTHTIKKFLDILLGYARVKIRTEEDPARLRPSDVPILWADPSKFRAATGWEPKIPLEQTLRDVLDYWRERVKAEGGREARAEV